MKLTSVGAPHLTYCTNIHAGETWAAVRANIERYVVAVKSRIAPDRPFGVGLRLSAQAADTLTQPATLDAFRELLRVHGLYVFTLNGFPYGTFHGQAIKERVYLPDWRDEARLAYTDRLAAILAALLPDDPGLTGSISTVPGAFKPRVTGEADVAQMVELLLRHVAALHALAERTGKSIALALEPEPCCYLETVAETVAFFERHLFSRAAVKRLGALTGLGESASEACLRSRLTVCFDACHMAVEFEAPEAALGAFEAAGIAIGKIQLSAGLTVPFNGGDETLQDLRPFAEDVYLHQVVERRGGTLARYLDLRPALEALDRSADDREWRIHFHVPIFRERLGRFTNTQGYLRELLAILRRKSVCTHLEVETYTWDVLPAEYRQEDIVTAVERELRWVLERLGACP